MTFASKLSVVAAYIAFAFVGAIVLGMFLKSTRYRFLRARWLRSFRPPGVLHGFTDQKFEQLDPVMPPILKSLHIIPGSGVI
jgi:hypothetical protein